MTFVMFATICEGCHRRSEEYQAYPTCRTCGHHICTSCRDTDKDDPEGGTGICNVCAEENSGTQYP